MRIILSGGGTIGSVSPLLAVYQEIKQQKPETEVWWVATRKGPEIKLISSYNVPIKTIFSGKLRRYFSLQNFIDPLFIVLGFLQSIFLILKFKPQVIVSAGGFVSVPLIWAAWLLRKKTVIHQQDVIPGLANLLMARFATKITVTFEKSIKDFFPEKTIAIGNPVRSDILTGDPASAKSFFKLEEGIPTIVVIGGGTGSLKINQMVTESLESLTTFCQIIHLTGGKAEKNITHPRYHPFDFLTYELKDAFAVADVVVTRAGMSVLTELAALGKAAVVIPIAHTHQEANASELARHNAVILAYEENVDAKNFVESMQHVVQQKSELQHIGHNLQSVIATRDAARKMTEIIFSML